MTFPFAQPIYMAMAAACRVCAASPHTGTCSNDQNGLCNAIQENPSSTALLDALRDLCEQAERSLDYRPEFREALARGLAAIHHATQEQK